MLEPSWIEPKRTALVLIDLQVDFASPDGEMARRGMNIEPAQRALTKIQLLLRAAREAGVKVVFVRLECRLETDDKIAQERKRRRAQSDERELCVLGSKGAEFAGPCPQDDEMTISKYGFSIFTANGFSDQLQRQGYDTLVLSGLTTECCVQVSAWDAFERNFHVFIASDACAAYERELHENALKALTLSGIFVEETARFIQVWNASTMRNRQI